MLHMTFYSLPFTPERPQATEARLEKIYEAAKFGLKGDSLALAAGLTPAQYRRLSEFDPLVEMAEMKGRADGEMTAAHRYTLDRLAAEPGRLLVVCAAATSDAVPAEIAERCDALIWKALPGFDFSAYGIALRHLAAVSPGCDAFVMNDSVLGPFASPAAALADAPWDLAGFTGSWLFENHIQSYAFQLREVTPGRVAALAPVLSRRTAFNRYMDVVICQETRLARVAARTMRVGARFFVADRVAHNPSLHHAAMLARAGVPFIKRSLLTHYAAFQDRTEIAAIVAGHGHPLPEGA